MPRRWIGSPSEASTGTSTQPKSLRTRGPDDVRDRHLGPVGEHDGGAARSDGTAADAHAVLAREAPNAQSRQEVEAADEQPASARADGDPQDAELVEPPEEVLAEDAARESADFL